MNIYVAVKEYPGRRKQYRLLRASDDELARVQDRKIAVTFWRYQVSDAPFFTLTRPS